MAEDNKPLSKIAENHPRIAKGLCYRGLAVAPGTALYEALIANNKPGADALYDVQKADYIKAYGEESWNRT